jgi:hypothetical protein
MRAGGFEMNTKQEGKQLPKNIQIKRKNKAKNSIGCLIILLIGGYYFIAYFPGFLDYRDKLKRQFAFPFIETIHSSLKTYSDIEPNNLFPEEIKSYEMLRQLIIDAGKSIPKNQADTKIDYLLYETTDRKTYILRINIKNNDKYFYILYPSGIIETYKYDQIDDKNVMELIRTLLYMDQALILRNISAYISNYSSRPIISIKQNFYKGLSTEKNRKKTNSESYENLTAYINFLEKFYSMTLPKSRKRNEISIKKGGPDWELHSSYIEEGTFEGKKYVKEGRTIQTITLSKKAKCIVADKSLASIYMPLTLSRGD